MGIEDRERKLIEDYLLVPDLQERMMLLISRKLRVGDLEDADRKEENIVRGCQSRVWVAGSLRDGAVTLSMDAESIMVKGLAGTVCDIFHGGSPRELVAHELKVFEELGIDSQLTPTRLNGLANVREAVRTLGRRYILH